MCYNYNGRKFRSQTSKNMDKSNAKMGRVREEKRREEKTRPEKRREEKKEEEKVRECQKKVRRKKIQVRENLGKSRNTVFFQRLVALEGQEVGSLMRRVRDEKSHVAAARSIFGSQNVQNTPYPDHLWRLTCPKKCTPLCREVHVQVNIYKTHHARTAFGS